MDIQDRDFAAAYYFSACQAINELSGRGFSLYSQSNISCF